MILTIDPSTSNGMILQVQAFFPYDFLEVKALQNAQLKKNEAQSLWRIFAEGFVVENPVFDRFWTFFFVKKTRCNRNKDPFFEGGIL